MSAPAHSQRLGYIRSSPALGPQIKRDQPWAGPSDAYHEATYSSSSDSARCRSMASLISSDNLKKLGQRRRTLNQSC